MSHELNMIIVDDEPLARERLISTFPFREHGYQLIGTAGDGEKALRICSEQPVHIVITDIVMPRMDGLELTQRLKELYPHIKVILLSNYQEFEFARQAMQFGAIGYLLKVTSDHQELLGLLERARREIMAQEHRQSEEIRQRHHYQQHLGVLRQHFLQELLNEVPYSEQAIHEKFDYMGMPRPSYALSVLLIRIDRYDSLVSMFPPKDIALLKYALSQMAEELAHAYTRASVLPKNEQDIVLLCHWSEEAVQSEAMRQAVSSLTTRIEQSVRTYLPFSVTVVADSSYSVVAKNGFAAAVHHAVEAAESVLASHTMPDALITEPIAREDMQRALDYISEHYNEALSLTDVCEQIGISPSYFSHLFKKVVGFNFSEYLTIYRVQQAKLLLTDTSMQVQDIARSVGIPDYKYFSKIFRKYAHVAPTEFRNRSE
ncbi:response regulator [Paenibacillus sp. YYML68]|uniref:response regulator transcription factor n=1 Tax=Paenibacillus sp. YYML68 TaxID=2909250 RepID=UPI002490872F|nr:response regulator [Paenibacillus sp. YYML68]